MTAITEPLVLHEDVFYEYFKPYRHQLARHNIWGGHGLETFGEDLNLVRSLDPDYVWTVVDEESGNNQWIIPGVHFVNRVCYLVTKKSHHGIEVDFRCPHRLNSLTPLGLKRQMNKLQRALAEADCK